MSITDKIFTTLGLTVLPEVTNPKYHMADDGGVECEVGEFLYALIRMTKSKRILETGLYSCISCMYMAQALKDNGEGHIDSLEWEEKHITRSKERLIKMGLQDLVTIYHTDSLKFEPTEQYDFMFLDTELFLRFKELARFYDHLNPGGLVLIHDMNRHLSQGDVNKDHPDYKHWPVGELPLAVKNWINDGELVQFMFNTPRGLAGYYKRHGEDYKWM